MGLQAQLSNPYDGVITTLRRILSVMLVVLIGLAVLANPAYADLRDGAARSIAEGSVNAFAVDGPRVLYHDAQQRAISLYDTGTGSQRIVASSPGQVTALALSGDKAAYVTLAGWDQTGPFRMERNLYLLDLVSGESAQIGSGAQWGPLLAGGRLVWAVGSGTIFSYELATGAKTEVATADLFDTRNGPKPLHFDGRYLAWREGSDLVALDLTTGQRQARTVDRLRNTFALHGGRLLYGYQLSIGCSGSEREGIAIWEIGDNTVTPELSNRACGPYMPAPTLHGDLLAVATGAGQQSVNVYHLPTGQRVNVGADSRAKQEMVLSSDLLVYRAEAGNGSALAAVPLTFGQAPTTEWNAPYGKEIIADVGSYDVDSERILYEAREGNRLLLRNLEDGSERQLAQDAGGYHLPYLRGGWAVYQARSAAGRAVYLEPFGIGEKRRVVTHDPVIGPLLGDWGVIWAEKTAPHPLSDGSGRVLEHAFFRESMATGERKQLGYFDLAKVAGRQIAFDGPHLVWTEAENGATRLVVQNVVTGQRDFRHVEGEAEVLRSVLMPNPSAPPVRRSVRPGIPWRAAPRAG